MQRLFQKNTFYGGGARSKVRVSEGSRPGTSEIRTLAIQVDTHNSSDDNEGEGTAEHSTDSEEDTTRTVRGSTIRKREDLLGKCAKNRLSRKTQTCDSDAGYDIFRRKSRDSL